MISVYVKIQETKYVPSKCHTEELSMGLAMTSMALWIDLSGAAWV